MTTPPPQGADLAEVGDEALDELSRRVRDISNSYRALAEKMGQLYMCADELRLGGLTRRLDKPMRNAADNEQAFTAILDELALCANRRA